VCRARVNRATSAGRRLGGPLDIVGVDALEEILFMVRKQLLTLKALAERDTDPPAGGR